MKQIIKKICKIPILIQYYFFVLINKSDRKIILFESNVGRNYSGNPRFIYEEMVARGLDRSLRCYYILEDSTIPIPGNAKKVKRRGFFYFYLFSKAGFWVSDTRMPAYLKKRKDTIYIQTWHGTPLKKLALDMLQISMEGEKGIEDYRKNFIKNSSTWDYLLSQNSYSSEIFRRAFAFDKDILEIGYPRNDILFHKNNQEAILEMKERFKLPTDRKVILYAPTWRDNEHYGHQQYKFSSLMDLCYMQEQLADEYILLVKAHYLVGEQLQLSDGRFRGFVYEFNASYDIAELYLISDILVTDYSSVMFDYSLLGRPMLFFTYDLEKYKETLRGFYFDFINEAPGPLSITTEQLVKDILEYDAKQYQEKYQAFTDKYNHADCGQASKKVVDLILSLGGVQN